MAEENLVKNVSQFISEVFKKIRNLEVDDEPAIWFRGESSDKYNLVPNLYRTEGGNYWTNIETPNKVYQLEKNIDFTFSRKSSMFFGHKNIENSPWNRYFLKQHYGIKTRLLDWTENALIALFFAVKDYKVQQNGKVWILSPFKLNTYSVSKLTKLKKDFNLILGATKLENEGSIFNEKGEIRIARIMTKYYKMQCDKEESLYPLAIYPVHLDERMAAQQACFTIFGNVIKGLEDIDLQEKFTESIYIDSDSKIKILLELKQLGISYYSIYPDLDGLGKAINLEHSSEVFDLEWENDWNYNLM